MSNPILQFDNPTFREGVNITVRCGDKWLNRAEIGERIEMGGLPASGWAHIIGKVHCNFHDLPASIHKINHDPSCRTVSGIIEELDRIYGPFPNKIIGVVTVLFFTVEHGHD